jgi:hypothetical protein
MHGHPMKRMPQIKYSCGDAPRSRSPTRVRTANPIPIVMIIGKSSERYSRCGTGGTHLSMRFP